MSLHCAQRGCLLPDDATTGGLCPVCQNPLIVVVHDDAPVSHGQPIQEQPTPSIWPPVGEDGAALVDVVEDDIGDDVDMLANPEELGPGVL